MKRFAFLLLTLPFLLVCCVAGGYDSAKKINKLQPGMTIDQVEQILGPPETTSLRNGKLSLSYSLHQEWKGNVFYDLTFDGQSRKLESWVENEQRYQQSQLFMNEMANAMNAATQSSANEASAPSGPNNPTLQGQIAGTWWGYSGSTERKVGLCADGRYHDYTESGYSGRSYDAGGNETMAWGNASQGGGSGRWTINGDTQTGTISVNYAGGGSARITYKQVGEPGCLDFNGDRLCRSSASCD